MNNENTSKLFQEFPRLFRDRENSCMGGFACGDGWYELIFKLCAAIESEAMRLGINPESGAWPRARQVKEKFGTLSFYCSAGDIAVDERDGDHEGEGMHFEAEAHGPILSLRPVPNVKSIYKLITDAAGASAHICETCGQPGKLRTNQGWWRTNCDACEKVLGQRWQGDV